MFCDLLAMSVLPHTEHYQVVLINLQSSLNNVYDVSVQLTSHHPVNIDLAVNIDLHYYKTTNKQNKLTMLTQTTNKQTNIRHQESAVVGFFQTQTQD